jgi:uncharacterized spore protein YtfJ
VKSDVKILDQVKDLMSQTVVYGQPYEKNGVTVIPASRVWAGGGGGQASANEEGAGGGVGIQARPAGAFVIKGEQATWVPATDAHRIILVGQLLAIVAVLSWRSVAKARMRERGRQSR